MSVLFRSTILIVYSPVRIPEFMVLVATLLG